MIPFLRVALVSLNAGRGSWLLPQLNVPDYVDFSWEPLAVVGRVEEGGLGGR